MTRRAITHLLLTALVALLLAGCPTIWNKSAVEEPPKPDELFKQAQEKFDKEEYDEAIDLYQRLQSAHPDFEKIPEVSERIADSYFNLGKYSEAIARYGQFRELYPNHEDNVRAKYMVAMAYFKQIKDTDLDSSMVRRAERAFEDVMQEPNAGEWKEKSEEKHRECRKKLAQKELYKARTYRNLKRYRAARIAAQRVLDKYPDLGLEDEAEAIIEDVKDE